jgi:hypothetical protein
MRRHARRWHVTEPALVIIRQRRVNLKVSRGEIVPEHIEADVEQIAPATHPMIKQRRLMLEQQVVTSIERMAVNGAVRTQQVRQSAPPKPLPMQPPLTARGEQSVHHQNQQYLIPPRALASGQQTLRPKLIELQLLPQLQRQPAPAPLARPLQPQPRELEPHDRLIIVNSRLVAIFRKQRQRVLRRALGSTCATPTPARS